MQRLAVALVLAFVLTACNGTASDTTDAPTAAPTTAAPTTMSTTTTTATTTTTTTTTTVAPTTTTIPAEFDTRPGTPPHEFDSYAVDLAVTMAFGELEINIDSEGTWTRDAFRCDVTTAIGGLLTTQSFIATPDTVWADKGAGYNQTGATAGSEQELVSSCPSSPLFWEAFVQEEFETGLGEEEMFEGRLASKIDIRDLPADFEDMAAVAGFAGASVDHLVIWVDIETGVFLAMTAQMELSEELMQGAGDTGPVAIEMDFTISQVNNPALVLEVP